MGGSAKNAACYPPCMPVSDIHGAEHVRLLRTFRVQRKEDRREGGKEEKRRGRREKEEVGEREGREKPICV